METDRGFLLSWKKHSILYWESQSPPSTGMHALVHARTQTQTSLRECYSHVDACRCRISIWIPTFVGKFKGPWRFCTFCSELGRPVGTKSHISKALPGSIMTKGIGLIVFQRATFSNGCVYLNIPGHFLYVFQHHRWQIPLSRTRQRTIWRFSATHPVLFCSVLYGSLGLWI